MNSIIDAAGTSDAKLPLAFLDKPGAFL